MFKKKKKRNNFLLFFSIIKNFNFLLWLPYLQGFLFLKSFCSKIVMQYLIVSVKFLKSTLHYQLLMNPVFQILVFTQTKVEIPKFHHKWASKLKLLSQAMITGDLRVYPILFDTLYTPRNLTCKSKEKRVSKHLRQNS